MSEAQQFLSDLNSELSSEGEWIILRRITGAVFFDARVRGFVRAVALNELVGTVAQTDSKVTISPTDIIAAGWPGPGVVQNPPPTHSPNPILPRIGDKVIIQGRIRNINFVKPTVMDDLLIRIDLMVSGGTP